MNVVSESRVSLDTVFAISPDWRLRPDGDRVVAYKYSTEELIYCPLPFEVGLAVSLLDGRHSIGSLAPLIMQLLEVGSEDEVHSLYASALQITQKTGCGFLAAVAPDTGEITLVNPVEFLRLANQSIRASIENHPSSTRLGVPLQVVLMPTYVCRTDCVYCYAERRPVPKNRMLPLSRWLEVIDEMGENGIDMVVFSGGDPLLYPGILKLIQRLQYWKTLFLLPTKAHVSVDGASRLRELLGEVGTLQVSIDGVDPAVLDKIAGRRGFCNSMWESLVNLSEAAVPLRTQSVITPLNYDEVPALIKRLHSLHVPKANITNYNRSYYRHDDSLFLSPRQIAGLRQTVDELRQHLGFSGLSCNAGVSDPTALTAEEKRVAWPQRAACSGGRSGCCITPDGQVILCEQMPQEPPFLFGDLHKNSLLEIWHGERIAEFLSVPRASFQNTACYDCGEFEHCNWHHGRCFRDAYFTYGSLYQPPPNCPSATGGFRMG